MKKQNAVTSLLPLAIKEQLLVAPIPIKDLFCSIDRLNKGDYSFQKGIKKMTYKEYREKRQKECNALPIFFAFSDTQFEKCLTERGLTSSPEDLKKLVRLPGNGFCLKTDLPKVDAFAESDNLDELMKDSAFAKDAFAYEMWNHEYAINMQGDWDVCSCFGTCEYADGKTYVDYLKEMGFGDDIIDAYFEAKSAYLKESNQIY